MLEVDNIIVDLVFWGLLAMLKSRTFFFIYQNIITAGSNFLSECLFKQKYEGNSLKKYGETNDYRWLLKQMVLMPIEMKTQRMNLL